MITDAARLLSLVLNEQLIGIVSHVERDHELAEAEIPT